ncbi:hypothetical protein EXN66_Car000525 [Channa argus]|uniref:Uncharacterized protein n=1 Tax=Channa argus TaxID=215402 RepID=A0A6G1QXJ8_CHAAH|nr:hypothetical protein EXN66_Car000525 [Channa argus]
MFYHSFFNNSISTLPSLISILVLVFCFLKINEHLQLYHDRLRKSCEVTVSVLSWLLG